MKTFRRDLRKKLKTTHNLPAIPAVAILLQEALADERSSAEDVSRIISSDPSLSTNILKLANSAWYPSSGNAISTISEAVVRIGMHEIGELSSALTVIQSFNEIGNFKNHSMFWKHCIVVACASGYIARTKPDLGASEAEAYTAGLLHDIGMLVLEQYFSEIADQVWAEARKRNKPVHETELEMLKIDHGEVGGKLLKYWGIPEHIVQAVSWHHRPESAEPKSQGLTRIVHIADCISNQIDATGAGHRGEEAIAGSTIEGVQLSEGMIAGITGIVNDAAEKSETIVSMASGKRNGTTAGSGTV